MHAVYANRGDSSKIDEEAATKFTISVDLLDFITWDNMINFFCILN